MNSSQFKKLIAVLLIVGGVGLLFLSKDRKAWEQSEAKLGGKVIADFPLNDITSISFKNAESETGVSKKNDIWTVSDRWDYPADFSKVRDLVQDVWDLKIARNITAGPSQYGRLGLVTPGKGADSGILLSFKGENNAELHNLLLGKEHMRKSEAAPSQFGGAGGGDFPDGRYVLPDGKGEAIALVSETFSSIDVDAKYWLNKDFIKIEKVQSATVTHPEEADSWSTSRDSDTADMTLAELAEGEELDSTKSYSLKNILSSPSFNDIADPSTSEDDLGFSGGVKAQLKTFDGFTYDLKIGKADGEDNYPISVSISAELPTEREMAEDEKEEDKERLDTEFAANNKKLSEKLEKEKVFESWTYLVSKWTVDALLNKRIDLIKNEDEEGEAAAAPTGAFGGGGPTGPFGGAGPQAPDMSTLPANIQEQIRAMQEQAAGSAASSVTEALEELPTENVDEAIDAVTNPLPTPEE
jgi:hypothetical protein